MERLVVVLLALIGLAHLGAGNRIIREGAIRDWPELANRVAPTIRPETTGTSFSFAFLNNHLNIGDTSYTEVLSLVVTNPGTVAASITITAPLFLNFTTINQNVPAGQSVYIPINPVTIQTNYGDQLLEVVLRSNNAIFLTSTQPVSVVAENQHSDEDSSDTFSLIPNCELGSSYRVVTDMAPIASTNIFVAVATVDYTLVNIFEPQAFNYTVALMRGQTASIVTRRSYTTNDLVTANASFSLISGAVCGYGFFGPVSCSHESVQLAPISDWGLTFPIAPFLPPKVTELVILTAQPNTTIYRDGQLLSFRPTPDIFLLYQFVAPQLLTSDKPIQIVAVGASDNQGNSAPFFINIPPTSWYTSQPVQFATGMTVQDQALTTHYVRITTTEAYTGNITIDGIAPSALRYIRVGRGDYYYVDVKVNNGTHSVTTLPGTTGTPNFNVLVYGYGSYIGYGFSPGLNLPQTTSGSC